MAAWGKTVRAIIAVVCLTVIAQAQSLVATRVVAASECRTCRDPCQCPAPEPVLETPFGASLFWQDPCGNGYRDELMPCYVHNSGPPTWFGSAEFLPLIRDESGWIPFQAVAYRDVEVTSTTPPLATVTFRREAVLSTSDFDNDFSPGLRAMVGRALGDWYRVEFSYLGSYSWDETATVRRQSDLILGSMLSPFSSFGNPGGPYNLDPLTRQVVTPPNPGDPLDPLLDPLKPVPGIDYNGFARVSFSSRLDAAEANIRRRLCVATGRYYHGEASCLVGLRYLKLSEEFGYEAEPAIVVIPVPVGRHEVNVTTDNDLIGPQLGAMAQMLVHDRAWIDVELKGALLFSDARTSVGVKADSGNFETKFFGSHNSTAFLGDLSVNLNYQVAPSLTIRAGYNAYWLTGVALATENFVANATQLPYMLLNNDDRAQVDHRGSVVFHGPSLGIVLTH